MAESVAFTGGGRGGDHGELQELASCPRLQWTGSPPAFKSAVPHLFDTKDRFRERQFFYRLGRVPWFQDDSSAFHFLGTFYF